MQIIQLLDRVLWVNQVVLPISGRSLPNDRALPCSGSEGAKSLIELPMSRYYRMETDVDPHNQVRGQAGLSCHCHTIDDCLWLAEWPV